MEIISRHGMALVVLKENFGFDSNSENDIICENISVFHPNPNTRQILLFRQWGKYAFLTIEDVEQELEDINDPKIRWRSEKRKKILLDYFTNVHLIMKTYKREEQINKVLNSNECQLHLAC